MLECGHDVQRLQMFLDSFANSTTEFGTEDGSGDAPNLGPNFYHPSVLNLQPDTESLGSPGEAAKEAAEVAVEGAVEVDAAVAGESVVAGAAAGQQGTATIMVDGVPRLVPHVYAYPEPDVDTDDDAHDEFIAVLVEPLGPSTFVPA
eukprot:1286499-Alexandrium_andersonii.AAC.1